MTKLALQYDITEFYLDQSIFDFFLNDLTSEQSERNNTAYGVMKFFGVATGIGI